MPDPQKNAPLQPLFVVAVEGEATENAYLGMLQQILRVPIRCLPTADGLSAPVHVSKRLVEFRKTLPKNPTDQFWVVIDRDRWVPEQLSALYAQNFKVAISNPCFETWLLAHFEDSTGFKTCNGAKQQLRHHVPGIDKHLRKFSPSREQIL